MTTSYPNKKIPIRELQLADIVQCFDGPFGTGTVIQIRDGQLYIERPYGHSQDFSYTGGVLTFIGHETIIYRRDSGTELFVYRRKEMR